MWASIGNVDTTCLSRHTFSVNCVEILILWSAPSLSVFINIDIITIQLLKWAEAQHCLYILNPILGIALGCSQNNHTGQSRRGDSPNTGWWKKAFSRTDVCLFKRGRLFEKRHHQHSPVLPPFCHHLSRIPVWTNSARFSSVPQKDLLKALTGFGFCSVEKWKMTMRW